MSGVEREIYLYCDTGHSLKKIVRFAAQTADGPLVDKPAIKQILDQWVDERIMAYVDGRYLSLALRAPSGH